VPRPIQPAPGAAVLPRHLLDGKERAEDGLLAIEVELVGAGEIAADPIAQIRPARRIGARGETLHHLTGRQVEYAKRHIRGQAPTIAIVLQAVGLEGSASLRRRSRARSEARLFTRKAKDDGVSASPLRRQFEAHGDRWV